MKERKSTAQSKTDDDDTITNVTLFPPDPVDTDSNMRHLDMAVPASNTSYSLGRLEHDLKALHEKWNTVEQEMSRRDRQIADLQREIDSAQHENGTLRERKRALESDLEERQNSAVSTGIRLTEIETKNVELRVHLQELQDYIDGRKSEWDSLNAQLREYEATIQGINSCLEEHEAVVAAKEDEKAALAVKVMDLERELAELKGKHAERESTNAELQQALNERARELGNLNAETIGLHKEIERLTDELKYRDGVIEGLERDLEERTSNGAVAKELLESHTAEVGEIRDQLTAATTRIEELEATERSLRELLDTTRAELEQVGVNAAEQEIRAVELKAVLLEAQSDQKKHEAELEAQCELIQMLEAEVASKQQALDVLEQNADRLSAIRSGVREIDFQIDERWCEEPAKLSEESDRIFEDVGGAEAEASDAELDDVLVLPEEIFPEPEDLAEHVIVSDEAEGEPVRYALTAAETVIGRSHKADIRLNNKYISRRHARIRIDDDGAVIEDAGSMNGFLVNSEPARRHRLVHGDRLEIGKSKFRYLDLSMT